MNASKTNQRLPILQLMAGGVLVIAISIMIFTRLMSPPLNDLMLMVLFLSITTIASLIIGILAYRVGWIYRLPTIRWRLLGGYALASLLTFLNVWITARLMFASDHDLKLATVLLIFAGGIAMVLGYLLSSAISSQLHSIEMAVQRVALGDLETRVQVAGQDELSRLATSFNRMAFQLEEAERHKDEADRMRRDLIAWVSHDLQTPLASLQAMVEALADGVIEDQPTVQRYLTTMRREIGGVSILIDDLFQLAQLDAGGLVLHCERDSLSDLISDTIESFTELANQREISLRGEVQPGTDPVFMDARRMGRVLSNLISNGIQHTPPGGMVEVQAKRDPDGIHIRVSDTGEGIPPSDLEHIFERFYRGDKSRNRSTGGAGLGLAIARVLVEAHGGILDVASKTGDTIFTIQLPDPKANTREQKNRPS